MKKEDYIIRDAVKEDADCLDALLTQLIHYEAQFDANLNQEFKVRGNYGERIGLDGHKLLVTEVDGRIVGFIYGFVYHIPEMFMEPIVILDALYVMEEYRHNGYARAMFQQFREFAKQCHACRIELKVISENLEALRFYEKLSFCESKKYMQMECLDG